MAKQWKQVQRADSDFSGNVTGTFGSKGLSDFYRTDNKPTKSDVGLGNLDNTKFSAGKFIGVIAKSDGTSVFDPSTGDFTGKIDGETAANIKTKATAGNEAKDAVDGNKTITMVGGSLSIGTQSGGVYPFSVDTSGNLKIKDDEFQALADGTVNCKGNFTINQDTNGDSKIVLAGDTSGTAEVEVNGANPTFDLGGASPLGTSTLFLKRKLTSNQARIQFQTGTGPGAMTNQLNIGVSNNTINGRKDQFAINYGPIWSSGTAPERGLTFDYDGKMGVYANTKTVSGFTFGSDGTNKHVYIKDGSLGINTAPSDSYKLDVDNGVTRLNRGNSSGNIAEFRGQNAPKMTVKTTGVDIVGAVDVVGGLETSGNVFVGNHLTIDGGDLSCYNDATVAGSLDAASFSGNGAGLTNVVPKASSINSTHLTTYAINSSAFLGSNVVTNSKLADNSVTKHKAHLGWHTQTKIFIPPSEFVVNDDNAYGNLALIDNGGQARVMYSAHEAYANVPIPAGYKVTHWRVNGTASVTVSLSYSTIATSTTTSCQAPAQQFTNNTNVSNPSSGVTADETNGRYLVIGWFPADTAKYLYGAVLTIAKI